MSAPANQEMLTGASPQQQEQQQQQQQQQQDFLSNKLQEEFLSTLPKTHSILDKLPDTKE
eukprot:UN02776